MRYYNKISTNFRFFLFRHVETRYDKTCDSKSKATDIGLLRGKTNSLRAKIQTCKFPLGQYAKFQ